MTAAQRGMMKVGELVARSLPPQFDFVVVVYPKKGTMPSDQLVFSQVSFVSAEDKARAFEALEIVVKEGRERPVLFSVVPTGGHNS